MNSMARCMATAAVVCLGAGAAAAQPVPTFSDVQRAVIAQQNAQMRISVGINMFVAGPAGFGPEALQAQERARRQIYELATKECAVLKDVIASECRIENVNVNINRHQSAQQAEGFNVSANMSFRVSPK